MTSQTTLRTKPLTREQWTSMPLDELAEHMAAIFLELEQDRPDLAAQCAGELEQARSVFAAARIVARG